MNKRFRKYRLLVICLASIAYMSVTFADSNHISKIQLKGMPKEVNVGEKVLIEFEITPESIEKPELSISIDKSGGAEILRENGQYYFYPKRNDLFELTIKSANGRSDTAEIFAKTMLRGVDIRIENLEKKNGRYVKYLGMDVISTCYLNTRSDVSSNNLLISSVVWQKGKLESKRTDGESFNGYSEKDGVAVIEVTSDDNGYTDRIEIRNTPMTKGIEIDESATIVVGNSYKPGVTFMPEKDLLYGYTDVINKELEISFEKVYIANDYLETEIKYEEEKIKSIQLEINNANDTTKKKILYEGLNKHLSRKIRYKNFLRSKSGSYSEVDESSGNALTDRRGYYINVAEIVDGKIVGHIPGKVRLRIQPKDYMALFKYMDVFITEDIEDQIIINKDGKRVSIQERKGFEDALKKENDNKIDESLKVNNELDKKIILDSAYITKVNDFYNSKIGRPSPWAKELVYEASTYDLLTEDVQKRFGSNISREEFIDLSIMFNNKLRVKEHSGISDAKALGLLNRMDTWGSELSEPILKKEAYMILDRVIELSDYKTDGKSTIEIPYVHKETITKEQAIVLVLETYRGFLK